jgi:parallel beta-helix repeat protein
MKRVMGTAFVVTALFGLAVAVPAAANATPTTLFVDRTNASCSDTGSGTSTVPYCTIGKGAAVATAGQTVEVVKASVYGEQVTPAHSGTSGHRIVFKADTTGVKVSGHVHGFSISSRSYITVQGFTVQGTTGSGIYVASSSNIAISGNVVTGAGMAIANKTGVGIFLTGTTSSVVSGNQTSSNTDHGISLVSGSTGNDVTGNTSFGNARGFQRAAAGINVESPNNTIDRNITYSNEDSGIGLTNGASSCVLVDNRSYNNGDHGIDVLNSGGAVITSNSVYKNVTAGINVEGTSSGASIADNIMVDNGINSPRTTGNLRVDSNSTSGTSAKFDEFFLHSGMWQIVWGTSFYSSVSAFKAAVGKEAKGLQADPKWANASGGDLTLLSGSPAIDSASSGVSGETITDAVGNPRVDDPSTPNTGSGTRHYDDRGALEYQPPA